MSAPDHQKRFVVGIQAVGTADLIGDRFRDLAGRIVVGALRVPDGIPVAPQHRQTTVRIRVCTAAGPFLLTQFIGNLNNFNVIFLLNQGNPKSLGLAKNAGATDLLVTWLYKMTINDSNYKIAAVIGIMVFLVTAIISLVVYNVLPSVRDEEGFQ